MAVSQDSSSRRLAGLAVAWRGDRVFYLDLAHPGARAAAAAILARPGPAKVAFDAKGLLHALAGTKAGPGGGGGAPSSCPLSTAPLAQPEAHLTRDRRAGHGESCGSSGDALAAVDPDGESRRMPEAEEGRN